MSDQKQSVFDSRDLNELHQAYQGTCEELRFSDERDAERRKEAAALIMQMAAGGERDPVVLKRRAVLTLRNILRRP